MKLNFFPVSQWKMVSYCISLIPSEEDYCFFHVFLIHVYFLFSDLSVHILCYLPAGVYVFCLWRYRNSLYNQDLSPFMVYIYYRYFLLVTCFCNLLMISFLVQKILIFHEATFSSLFFFFKILLMVIAYLQRNLKWACQVPWKMLSGSALVLHWVHGLFRGEMASLVYEVGPSFYLCSFSISLVEFYNFLHTRIPDIGIHTHV